MSKDITLSSASSVVSSSESVVSSSESVVSSSESVVPSEGIKKLPVAVHRYFSDEKGMTDSQITALANLYEGPKKKPSFQEWLEVYQQYMLMRQSKDLEHGIQMLNSYREGLKKDLELAQGSDDFKEIKRLQKFLDTNQSIIERRERLLLDVNRELNKSVQNQLVREQPKKIEKTVVTVKPGDIANLMKTADIIEDD